MPFFSICIPAYKNVAFLSRLLDSIFKQTFTDYEIIITDDSPGDEISTFLKQYHSEERLLYFKNAVPLGTPENWNESIRRATGNWIKLMHDDDWFCTPNALQIINDKIKETRSEFLFSAYYNIYLNDYNRIELVICPRQRFHRVLKFAPNLYAKNIIGPPSVTAIKNNDKIKYDTQMKWLVDIDYYIRKMKYSIPDYISTPLIYVGMSDLQVTSYTHNKPEVEIPEGLHLLSKIGENAFNHILYFDAWWRLLRNVAIRSITDFKQYSGDIQIPHHINTIIAIQRIFPLRFLRFGFVSKILMSFTWIYCQLTGNNKT